MSRVLSQMSDPGRFLQSVRTLRDYAAKGCWEAQVGAGGGRWLFGLAHYTGGRVMEAGGGGGVDSVVDSLYLCTSAVFHPRSDICR